MNTLTRTLKVGDLECTLHKSTEHSIIPFEYQMDLIEEVLSRYLFSEDEVNKYVEVLKNWMHRQTKEPPENISGELLRAVDDEVNKIFKKRYEDPYRIPDKIWETFFEPDKLPF